MTFKTELVGSTVEMLVLNLLAERPMYGFEIIDIVAERTDGAFTWKEGTLYPVLYRLEQGKFIRAQWQVGASGKRRKYYALTPAGVTHAKKKQGEWQTFLHSVNAVLSAARS